MASWESLTAFGTVLASALGFGVAHGKLRQKVNDMAKQIITNTGKIAGYDAALAISNTNVQVLNTMIAVMTKTQDRMEGKIDKLDERLARHCEEQK